MTPGPAQGGSDAATYAHPSLDELRAEAMARGRRPRRFGSWYATEHMLRAMRAYGWTIVVGALGQPLVYLFGLAVGLAALIQQDIPTGGGGAVSYLVFVAPALLMTATIAVASEEFTYPVMAGFKWRRYFYGFNASALSSPQIANGVMIAASARMLFAGGAYYLFIWAFGAMTGMMTVPDPATGWISVLIGLVAGLSFGMPLMAYAASLEADKGQFALVQRFVFMPMFLFSGTFYPLAVLPWGLQWIGWISPLWHATELGRMATFDAPVNVVMLVVHVGYLLVLSIGGYLLTRRAFTRRLAK
ncbi:ABC transporter permease [Microbacterium terrisoli]|uniref:ABC transporter permease n=1 Tax=Microbacterium terrisoli TaxID=3242192 RepID=UPI002805F9EB|nr:ABC transporter permease [Microbacterium protaetiae]